MSTSPSHSKVTFAQLGGIKGLFRNPGLVLMTLRRGLYLGEDSVKNRYYEQRRTQGGARARRWVVYPGQPDPSSIGPEWHAWLHYFTDTVLPDTGRKPWQKPHQANLTGTAQGYRPAGHDYEGGNRAHASADYQSWTPDL
jgi:NADH:ubiquinone oxidoreductase subunit